MGPSRAQPPSPSVTTSAPSTPRGGASARDSTTSGPPAGGRSGVRGVGQYEQRVEERVGSALDRRRVAHLVDTVAASALGRNEDHPGVDDAREVLRVVTGRRVETLMAQAEPVAHLL